MTAKSGFFYCTWENTYCFPRADLAAPLQALTCFRLSVLELITMIAMHSYINLNSTYVYICMAKREANAPHRIDHIAIERCALLFVRIVLLLTHFVEVSQSKLCISVCDCVCVCMWKAFSAIIRKVGSNRPRLHLQLKSKRRTRHKCYSRHEDCF